MPKAISWRKLVQKFQRLGFEGPFSGGRHLFMKRGTFKIRVPNPHREDISKYLLAEILRQAEIKNNEWEGV